MADLRTKNESFPFIRSYHRVIEDLHQWHTNIVSQLDHAYENVLLDMNTIYGDVHYFTSFTNALLLEYENELLNARSNEEIDRIEERIEQIQAEIQLLQSLSFRLKSDSVHIKGQIRISYNDSDVKSTNSLLELLQPCSTILHSHYRFLLSRADAIELNRTSLPIFRLTSSKHGFINECVLTFNVFDLNSFVKVFNLYWDLLPNQKEIRLLIPPNKISFIMGKMGETARQLSKRFQLDQMKVFFNSCPKSDERVLLIQGQRRDLIKDCLEEIYFNIEEKDPKELINAHIQLYDPSQLSTDDIEEILMKNDDYGGFIQKRTRSIGSNRSQSLTIVDEESTDDEDLWNENDDWWNCRSVQEHSSETIERQMNISNSYAAVFLDGDASRIEQIQKRTGASLSVRDDTSDAKRTLMIEGTGEQVDRACACIEKLIERFQNDKQPAKARLSQSKRKGK